MPRIFNRVISFKIEGEIYDQDTSAEDIIRNYSWTFKKLDNNGKETFCLTGEHKDSRGHITNITRLPQIKKWKKPDTEYFII